ncbi:uncharacterized protein LOC111360656 [Spodoptera litura]|uniref:Uncharacterized protein LOC111360656 n=1 Tax=Spodoptera litura TaxID=69820 RepID=A0A9J7EKC8_SPOLT|nr:uncharacterized protein LOC111360656 [Spodoptera litura]
MAVRHFIIKALCVTLCLAYNSPSSNEESAREFIEHVLRIPNPEKILNSARGRLERARQQELLRQRVAEADCEDPSELLPEYTAALQGSRELRQLGAQKHYPICHLERKIKKLNTNEYEYRPAYYEEVRCTMTSSDDIGDTNEVCSSLGFACVQWNKTIHLTRRRYSSDCWETSTMVIPAGCECMWPVHRLGDMNLRA